MSSITTNPTVLYLGEDNFASTLAGTDKPVLVDFWAEWCPPCRSRPDDLDRIAAEQAGKAVVAKVDTDAARDIARDYRISSIPTLIIFKNGREVDRMVGMQSKQEIERRLDAAA